MDTHVFNLTVGLLMLLFISIKLGTEVRQVTIREAEAFAQHLILSVRKKELTASRGELVRVHYISQFNHCLWVAGNRRLLNDNSNSEDWQIDLAMEAFSRVSGAPAIWAISGTCVPISAD